MSASTPHQPASVPLAERMRPQRLEEVVGQDALIGPGGTLARALAGGLLPSLILWGPPGSGKTTLARLLAEARGARFFALSAVNAGVRDVKDVVAAAEQLRAESRDAVLFLDEIHRFNKAQQDALLPHVERGTVILIGATTENPSFELRGALLSRTRVVKLAPLDEAALAVILERALTDRERGLGLSVDVIPSEWRADIADAASGDARRALNLLEAVAAAHGNEALDPSGFHAVLGERLALFDKGGDLFYDQISALHKSIRGSAPDAALYWFARMLEGGADPLYIARRLARMATEDIGLADPRALSFALDAWGAYERLGSPEGELALAEVVVYLAVAPKSNALYKASAAAREDAKEFGAAAVPIHLRNAPTRLMKEMGHGAAYRYAHDEPEAYAAGERYFPDGMPDRRYYRPSDRGIEARISERLRHLGELDAKARNDRKLER
ncbi:MAG TPA: replication-associated recombination protein A [Gammaproteobacteria bacterium]|nr:replication-associated recombination protein A [Gammaproteobacteria bacterium]